MKETFIFVGVIILILITGFLLTGANLASYQFWGPKLENAHRTVYEETKSYRDGSRRDFDNLYLAYKSAKSDDEKTAILSVMRERASSAPEDVVPTEVNQLLHTGN